ncbi:unnamed protein product [Schistosoma mattheei]|uniref:Uncharacterized protein n=1 Tax=Schistosoma mattheei TaxID=31246 RepID=A0A183PLM9_9TREM|nr:unnamed protein product [Schistosoma mattheei]
MKDTVDAQLRDQQAGFRKDRNVQTKLRHYGSSLSRTRHYTSTSSIMKKLDWIMETLTSEKKHGIKCTARNQLDLDFTYDLALLSRAHEQMQTTCVSEAFASLGIDIHKSKSKILKYNTENINPITLDGDCGKREKIHVPGKHHR